jgi:hypothetical protein
MQLGDPEGALEDINNSILILPYNSYAFRSRGEPPAWVLPKPMVMRLNGLSKKTAAKTRSLEKCKNNSAGLVTFFYGAVSC